MCFAEEFGHDIPPDDYFIYGGNSYSYRRRIGSTPSINFKSGNTIVGKTFTDIVCETDKAYLFQFEEGRAWVPKSRVYTLKQDTKKVYVPLWLRTNLQFIE